MGSMRRIATGLSVAALAGIAGASARFHLGRRRAEQTWAASSFAKLKGVGAVKRLSILPLIDWNSARDDLVGEAGVSYLVTADDTKILFDVGLNQRGEHPSPLLRNMSTLGMAPGEIDAVVISHPHLDHIGGQRGSVTISPGPVDLGDVPIFVPAVLECSTSHPTVVEAPRSIAPGVVLTGPIPRQDFVLGWTLEQSMAVNVEGKGVVIVIGCGHPTVERIIDRVEALFDAPIYGLVGGLHYPVTSSRWMMGPLPLQRIVGTGKWPVYPINREDVRAGMTSIRDRHPKLVALSAHDSCDWSLSAFRREFPGVFQEVVVGQEIVVQA